MATATTYTFLFTDVEGSTRLLQELGDAFQDVMRAHGKILRAAIESHGGVVERTEGDSFFALFTDPNAAVAAAVAGQRGLAAHTWPSAEAVAVRMGLHTGQATLIDERQLVGIDIHRAARVHSIAWGGQIVLSEPTRLLLNPVAEFQFLDLGEHRVKDIPEPEHLHQVLAPGLRETFPPLRSLERAAHALPEQLTDFIGREREVGEVADLLDVAKCVTLVGPGGTGKTRLSLRVGETVAARFPDGVHFVALSGITDPTLVASSIADAIGLVPPPDRRPLDAVSEYLATRRVLLVVDNFEQVMAGAKDIAAILAAAPATRLVVSSRAALRIAGERIYPLRPLPLPNAGATVDEAATNDAVRLFAARATDAQASFELTEANLPAVIDIVRRVDGLPLAIELAAARLRLLPVEAVAERLAKSFELLAGGGRDVEDRQRTMRGAIAWSWDLLDEPARLLMARLSVFRGGATIEQIETVCAEDLGADVMDLLVDLFDNSLLRRLDDDRFSMLTMIREFAEVELDRLGCAPDVRARHVELFLSILGEQAPGLTRAGGGEALRVLGVDLDNLRAAFDNAVTSGDARSALQLVDRGWRLWQLQGHLAEARANAERALGMPGAESHPAEYAGACGALGSLAYWQGDTETAVREYRRELDLARSADSPPALAEALYNLAFVTMHDEAAATALLTEALDVHERIGDDLGAAKCRWGLCIIAVLRNDAEGIAEQADACIATFAAAGEDYDLAWAVHMRAVSEVMAGRFDDARRSFNEALQTFVELDDASSMILIVMNLGLLAESDGDHVRSLRLLAAAERLGEELGTRKGTPGMVAFKRDPRSEDVLPSEDVERHRAEGRQFSLPDMVRYALA